MRDNGTCGRANCAAGCELIVATMEGRGRADDNQRYLETRVCKRV
jgi:hypothetical protein